MNITIPILVVLFFSLVIGVKKKKCFHRYKNELGRFSEPFKIDYNFQRNEFEVPNFFDQNSPLVPDYDLTTRFRSNVANVNPIQVPCHTSNVSSSLKELRQKIKCIPRDGVVHLKAPEGYVVSPTVVMVKKCGGMCNGAKCCLSKTTRDASFYVRSVNTLTNKVFCNSILVPEDTSCACGCQTKMTDCLPTQKYEKNMCVCKCINLEDYKKCVEKIQKGFRWDEKTCTCVCSITKICTTGFHWVPSQCRCAKLNN